MNSIRNFRDEELIAEVVARCQLGNHFRLDLEQALERESVPIVVAADGFQDGDRW
jgi:hypothetical protein